MTTKDEAMKEIRSKPLIERIAFLKSLSLKSTSIGSYNYLFVESTIEDIINELKNSESDKEEKAKEKEEAIVREKIELFGGEMMDRFMKASHLYKGWNDPLEKADLKRRMIMSDNPIDVANFAMFLWFLLEQAEEVEEDEDE
jgi:hypothetical protein